MNGLPEADAATHGQILLWLEIFAGHVRAVDYAAARPMWHPDVLAFGTHHDVIPGRENAIATQWDNVWPRTAHFAFDLPATRVLGGAGFAVAVAPWTSSGYAPDGARFDRPGRATLVFDRSGASWLARGWRCVHSHMSHHRGVPQASHTQRPVRAR
jgi:ketosteroid isomerase-like protein